jgi:hypothetical protein
MGAEKIQEPILQGCVGIEQGGNPTESQWILTVLTR